MIRFAWLTTACAVLLTACGGGVSSPDFQGQLVGVDILYPSSTTTSTARVTPGTTVQFDAVGLYSTAPGTTAGTGLVACPTAADTARVCRQGSISGVTWSVDASGTGSSGPVATIGASGLVTGVRRGLATVRARVANLEDATQGLIVNGSVLKSVAITSVDPKNNVSATSVPTGRSLVLTGIATCESGFSGGADSNTLTDDDDEFNATDVCTNLDYLYSWSLPSTADQTTVEFTPTSKTGEAIAIKTKKFGPFQIIAAYTNEEGIRKEATINLNASERVLDDIVVSADPVQAAPVPVVIGTKTRFIAKGVFSDGNTDDIRASDLKTALVWTQDASAVGKITIENSGSSPNAAVLVSGDTVGVTGLTATSSNTETNIPGKPNGLELVDRIGIEVKTFGLLGLVDICPFDSIGSECLQNRQLPLGSTTKFKARGKFQDNPNVPRDIDPTKIPLTWSKTVTPSTGDVTIVSAGTPAVTTGEVTATKQGTVTLNVAISDINVEPAASPRQVSAIATVTESLCVDQMLTSNGTAAAGSSTNVVNLGNVIDADANTFGQITVTQAGALPIGGGAVENASFRRDATLVTPPALGYNVGFLASFAATFNPEQLITIQTLDAQGNIVQGNDTDSGQLRVSASDTGVTRSTGGATTARLFAIKANATLPFAGLRIRVRPPEAADFPTDPEAFLEFLQSLFGGDDFDVQVWAACANFSD
ncbi:MAG: hypothetical protein Q8Q73_07590 [Stagnimonas sp.]|nr:hypothetical protein [Stagnimonas sp.]